jgi:hypothetical protein
MIENLLIKLSADKKPYPKSLLVARRAAYLSQVTLIASSGPSLKRGNGHGQGGSPPASVPMTPIMKVVLTVLLAANLALATYLAVSLYENWDRVQALLFGSPTISETAPSPLEKSTQPSVSDSTLEIATPPESTLVPSSTPEPETLLEESQPAGNNSADSPGGGAAEPDTKDKPGLHLGQTPHSPDEPPSQDQNNDQGKDNNKNKDK